MRVFSSMNKEKRFEALVQGHSTSLYRYAYWLCDGQQATAEDIVQETFLRAWKSLDQLQENQAAKAWLMTILRRENARRFERKQFDYADVELDWLAEDESHFEYDLDSHEMRRAMLKLEHKYRDPLLLQAVGGFSCEEIAAIMEVNKGAVMTRLFRAKKMLMQIMNPELSQQQSEPQHG